MQSVYRFEALFANVRAGWEKGSVENLVGYARRNRLGDRLERLVRSHALHAFRSEASDAAISAVHTYASICHTRQGSGCFFQIVALLLLGHGLTMLKQRLAT